MKQSYCDVLLVDDEQHILESLSLFLKRSGMEKVITLDDSRKVIDFCRQVSPSVIIMDLFMPYISGTELLSDIKKYYPEIPVIIVTADQEVESVVDHIKNGAFDYLVKPVNKDRLLSTVKAAHKVSSLRDEVTQLKKCLLTKDMPYDKIFSEIITNNQEMRKIFLYISAISGSSEAVLITGETGSGKELLARAIHKASGVEGDLVSFNIAGLDDTMFSDSLFGHRRGAYTGASQNREGLIAKASRGTLFLDEIGDLSKSSQVKLLRLLQEKKYYPLGSDVAKNAFVRVVAATNHNLKADIEQGKFRQDLYYRLTSHQIEVPPLRKRVEDILPLVLFFLGQAAQSMNKEMPEPSQELLTLLSNYHFPGNIRELRGMIYDAVAQHQSGTIVSMNSFKKCIRKEREDIHLEEQSIISSSKGTSLNIIGRFPTLKEAESLVIEEAMKQANENQGIAATILGISRPALNRRLNNPKV
ncbi:MAG: sigma-54-dependent Fis family transcriptional regulator [Gammaproteobacteria bacterium]|nr:MAG: sigma-54-dependent Fis family transcriptional regulator [Gammaproteobacteria bacterium]